MGIEILFLILAIAVVAFGIGVLVVSRRSSAPTSAPPARPARPTTRPPEPTADGAVDLASVCPSPLVIQTDWFPEAEHGALYEMVGDGYTVDTENLTRNVVCVRRGQKFYHGCNFLGSSSSCKRDCLHKDFFLGFR